MIIRLTILFLLFSLHSTYAADAASQQKLQACLKKADELPDIAAADAEAWFWHGGGEAARLCRDFALFNSGDYVPAAKGFAALAYLHEKTTPKQAAQLYAQAGLSYLRAEDTKTAETCYARALALTPNDADILTGRATARIGDGRYWDAITDLNAALKLKPNDIDALRQRGRAWTYLDNYNNAQADFSKAAMLSGEAVPADAPAPKQ